MDLNKQFNSNTRQLGHCQLAPPLKPTRPTLIFILEYLHTISKNMFANSPQLSTLLLRILWNKFCIFDVERCFVCVTLIFMKT